MNSIFDQVSALIGRVERPARYIGSERGSVNKEDAHYHFCMAYPDTYEIGQANQALRILCNTLNTESDIWAQRAFLPAPDMCDLLRSEEVPLFSIEGCNPVHEFDAIGITLPHELAATNVLEFLDLSGIALRSEERSDSDPLIIGGGPCATNPEPYAPFFDAIVIGEGEQVCLEIVAAHRELISTGASREQVLNRLSEIEGVYVPSRYDITINGSQDMSTYVVSSRNESDQFPIMKQIDKDFSLRPAYEPCVVPFTEVVHDRLTVEVLRGCTRGCRFCQAGMMYRPVRERAAGNIIASVSQGLRDTGYDEASLISLSTTDHSQIKEILEALNEEQRGRGIKISIPSQRLDSFGVDLADCIAGQKRGGLTFAPEAGSQRLRDAINKNVSEADIFNAVEAAFSKGWRRCKLYFMIGLPTETDEDVQSIAHTAEKVYEKAKEVVPPSQRHMIKIALSVALFVPKPHTPFQWDGQISADEAMRRVALVRESLKSKAIDLSWHDPSTSFIEAAMSRGDRRCARWVEAAWRRGARFDAWTEYFNLELWDRAAEDIGLNARAYAQKVFLKDDILPWSHIDLGLSNEFLKSERDKTDVGQVTPDCSFSACVSCGVCQRSSVSLEIQGSRHE